MAEADAVAGVVVAVRIAALAAGPAATGLSPADAAEAGISGKNTALVVRPAARKAAKRLRHDCFSMS